jgi:hypothetical protein
VGLVVGFLAGLWLESRAAGRRGEARA